MKRNKINLRRLVRESVCKVLNEETEMEDGSEPTPDQVSNCLMALSQAMGSTEKALSEFAYNMQRGNTVRDALIYLMWSYAHKLPRNTDISWLSRREKYDICG